MVRREGTAAGPAEALVEEGRELRNVVCRALLVRQGPQLDASRRTTFRRRSLHRAR